ncbi:hypothetical protein [Marivita sp.]|uniref:hypothetical protein n=1 Tax=Marivita sp. TaxID=2003365 RepID=UPI0025C24614|nr:hypothetical protein [Marivita sp.]
MDRLGVLLEKLSRNRPDPVAYSDIAAEVLTCVETLKAQGKMRLPDASARHNDLLRELFFAAKSAELRSPATIVGSVSGTSSNY